MHSATNVMGLLRRLGGLIYTRWRSSDSSPASTVCDAPLVVTVRQLFGCFGAQVTRLFSDRSRLFHVRVCLPFILSTVVRVRIHRRFVGHLKQPTNNRLCSLHHSELYAYRHLWSRSPQVTAQITSVHLTGHQMLPHQDTITPVFFWSALTSGSPQK